jgi:hypothetical protein
MAMVKVWTMGVSVCRRDVHVPVLVPHSGRLGRGGMNMIVMAVVMTMPMGVLQRFVAMLVFV